MSDENIRAQLKTLCGGLPLDPVPPARGRGASLPHAPKRNHNLTLQQKQLALRNALRYFPKPQQELLAAEFRQELEQFGHIYMYRFVPNVPLRAYPVDLYPAVTVCGRAIMLMVMNNLDPAVAQFPEELVTYGGNGQVLSNWAQFWLLMHYLSVMTEDQTLSMSSGHPLGLFPSHPDAPRVVITNGMVIPNYSSREMYDDLFALGVTMYGQMTAGSYCYIGPQGIVHGTTLTLLNAGRLYLKDSDGLSGRVFLSSGLGGMSGAQAKAAVICGCVGVIAEVSREALLKRHQQGWLEEHTDSLPELIKLIKQRRADRTATSIGYLGNVVEVWEYLVKHYQDTGELLVDLASDQTSLHNPYQGGYYPVQLTYEEAQEVMSQDPDRFKTLVQESLRRQVTAINTLAAAGLHFWDYGNAFLLEAERAGGDVRDGEKDGLLFRYPSYVQDIMGDIFSLGFGPFRWVCTSGTDEDLQKTDEIAVNILTDIVAEGLPAAISEQYQDNQRWVKEAGRHRLAVGSRARILYSDQQGRVALAQAFNRAVKQGQLKGPVVISRDHHDVSGTDSPFRETSNITDGSAFTADMAVQTALGNCCRGATWVAIHNGGGVGWGEVINGGFGLVLDGSEAAERRATVMLNWDVSSGVSRRCWSGNSNADTAIRRTMERCPLLQVTVPHVAADHLIKKAFE